jgi:hypothetical protein
VISAPYCLSCERKVDPDLGVLVMVDGATRGEKTLREHSWTCGNPECLSWLARAAGEEGCELLRPQGIFDPDPRPDGRPSWVVWISAAKRLREEESSGIFSAIYQPFTPTAR